MSGRRRPMKLEAAQSLWRLPSLGAGVGETVITGQDVASVVFAEAIGKSSPILVKLTDTFTKLANPAALPASAGCGATFDPTSTYLAIAHFSSPFVTIYKRSGDTFTKLANPAALPADTGRGATFDPTSTYLAIAHFSSPFVTIYKMDQKAYLGGNHILNITGASGVTGAGYAQEAGIAAETKQVVRIWRTGP